MKKNILTIILSFCFIVTLGCSGSEELSQEFINNWFITSSNEGLENEFTNNLNPDEETVCENFFSPPQISKIYLTEDSCDFDLWEEWTDELYFNDDVKITKNCSTSESEVVLTTKITDTLNSEFEESYTINATETVKLRLSPDKTYLIGDDTFTIDVSLFDDSYTIDNTCIFKSGIEGRVLDENLLLPLLM